MTQTKRVLRLENGRYLKIHQYSQGYHDFSHTASLFEAVEIDKPGYPLEHLLKFYPNSTVVTVEARIVE